MPKCYALHIECGTQWWLSSTGETHDWLDKFASLMRLRTISVHSNIHIGMQSDEQNYPHIIYRKTNFAKNKNSIIFGSSRRYGPALVSQNGPSNLFLCDIPYCKSKKEAFRAMRYAVQPIQNSVTASGGLSFHAALLEKDNEGFLIAGPSGTGKSTCCRQIPRPWLPLCDDEVLVVRGKERIYYCHPFPTWSDHIENRAENTWDVQHSVPLKAIFFLEQSDIDQALPLKRGIAATRIYESAAQVYMRYWSYGKPNDNRQDKLLIFENACEMAQKTPTFTLRATLHGHFWEEMERVTDKL